MLPCHQQYDVCIGRRHLPIKILGGATAWIQFKSSIDFEAGKKSLSERAGSKSTYQVFHRCLPTTRNSDASRKDIYSYINRIVPLQSRIHHS